MAKVISERSLLQHPLHIQEAEISEGNDRYERTRVNRQEAATVLIHNTTHDTIVLTKQFRYAVHDKIKAHLFELPAGKIEAGEDAKAAITRECLEETGYKVDQKDLHLLGTVFLSPGYTSELMHMFCIEASSAQKTEKGGGLAEEHEKIEVVEIPRRDFIRMVEQSELQDAKSLLTAMLWLNRNR